MCDKLLQAVLASFVGTSVFRDSWKTKEQNTIIKNSRRREEVSRRNTHSNIRVCFSTKYDDKKKNSRRHEVFSTRPQNFWRVPYLKRDLTHFFCHHKYPESSPESKSN